MNVAQEKTKSVWMNTTVVQALPLEGDTSADVVVIGSGIAGLSTAYELIGRGCSVVVLDRGRIGRRPPRCVAASAILLLRADDRFQSFHTARFKCGRAVSAAG